ALELSMTTAPFDAAIGPISRDAEAPALNRAKRTPSNDSGVTGATSISPPRNGMRRPAERGDARARTLVAGKFLCSKVRSISRPTTPVAPTTATVQLIFGF